MKTFEEITAAMYAVSDAAYESGFSFGAHLSTSEKTNDVFSGNPVTVIGGTIHLFLA